MTEPNAEIEVLAEDRIEQINIPGVVDGTVRVIYDDEGRASLDVSFFRGYLQGEPEDTPVEDADDFVVAGANIALPHYRDLSDSS